MGSIALFVWGFNFLKDQSIYDDSRTFYAEYANVQGLVPKSAVTINGLKVGSVTEISFHPEKPGILIAHLNLTNPIEFSKNSVAQIYSPDFISGKSLKIKLALDSGDTAQDGDTLIGEVDSGIMGMINEQIAPLQGKVESFVVHTDSVMQNVNKLMDAENQKYIKQSLADLEATLGSFRNTSKRIEKLVEENGKLDSLLNDSKKAMSNIAQITDSLKAGNPGETLRKLQASLTSIQHLLDSVEQGHGTLGKLMNDEELYENLAGASAELEALLREMKEHPKRFVHFSVFGKKEKPYEEPAKDSID